MRQNLEIFKKLKSWKTEEFQKSGVGLIDSNSLIEVDTYDDL